MMNRLLLRQSEAHILRVKLSFCRFDIYISSTYNGRENGEKVEINCLQIISFLLCWLYHMGLLDGLKKAIDTAGAQLTSSSPKPKDIYFTMNFQHKAKAWGLSEKDALDVFHHGQEIKPGMKTRKYNGYELSIYYGQSKTTGQPYISTIWKRERR